jgi:hypothetical protein
VRTVVYDCTEEPAASATRPPIVIVFRARRLGCRHRSHASPMSSPHVRVIKPSQIAATFPVSRAFCVRASPAGSIRPFAMDRKSRFANDQTTPPNNPAGTVTRGATGQTQHRDTSTTFSTTVTFVSEARNAAR